MPAQYVYSVSTGSNVDLSARVRAYRTTAAVNAEEGSTAISTFIVDDEESGINITGHRNFQWRESSESSNSRVIYDGYTVDRTINRGPFRVERARNWEVNVADLNSILNRRIMRGADANRPAETDVARIQWMVSTSELNILTDSTYISTSGPVAMDAADYRNQRVLDIIDDCAQQSGKNYFLILNENFAPARYGLFYDFAHSSAYSSDVRLTNILADVDSTTTYAVWNDDLALNRDPSRVYSGAVVVYEGGDQYVVDAAIASEFMQRDVMSPSWNVKTAAKARARGIRYLEDISTEEDRITMSYLVPLERVNRLKEGHTYQVKFSHLPGYTDWTWVRALKRTVFAISEEFYKVTLEATPGASTPTALTCPSQLSQLSVSEHGPFYERSYENPFDLKTTPPDPANYPAVVIVGFAGGNGFDASGTITMNAASYTQLWDLDASPLVSAGGYQALTSGSPGEFDVFFGNWVQGFTTLSMVLRTSATAPLQTASQLGSGGSVVFTNFPTAGSMLVMFRFNSLNGTPAGDGPADQGWTRIYTSQGTGNGFPSGGVQSLQFDVWCKCMGAGESKTQLVGDQAFTHWSFVSEWLIT